MKRTSILIVEDDSLVAQSLLEVLRSHGHEVTLAGSGEEAIEKLATHAFTVSLVDLRLPQMTGIDLLRRIKTQAPETDCLMMTSYATVETAVEAMKYGAADFLTKPIQDDELCLLLQRVIENQNLRKGNQTLKEQLSPEYKKFHHLIGEDPRMRKIYAVIEALGSCETTVLLKGESGTGKGMIAQAIHMNDPLRREGPYIEVSCGAIPRELLESELFGHVKGAFTSAFRDRTGRFEMAEGGTILLDEIDSLPPYLQVKLLRILQHKVYEMVGDTKTKRANVRIIAASNRNLEEEIRRGNFREDLYYRLNVITIDVPPLRERKSDIPALAMHFLALYNEKAKRNVRQITKEAMDALIEYNWPGNIRELENTLERVVVLSRGERIEICDFPEALVSKKAFAESNESRGGSLKTSLKDPEKKLIRQALERTGGNRKKAAEILNINRTTLYNKMREHQLI